MKESSLHDQKYFAYTVQATLRDIFILLACLGETVKSFVLEQIHQRPCFGLMTDEVEDIAVKENLATFIHFYNDDEGEVQTRFLSLQVVLEKHASPNAHAKFSCLLEELDNAKMPGTSLTGFSSDGAAAMIGKKLVSLHVSNK